MQNLPDKLPDDVDSLKKLVTQQASRNAQLTTENQHYRIQVLSLQEKLNLEIARRYAASSEKLSPDQLRLFTYLPKQKRIRVFLKPIAMRPLPSRRINVKKVDAKHYLKPCRVLTSFMTSLSLNASAPMMVQNCKR